MNQTRFPLKKLIFIILMDFVFSAKTMAFEHPRYEIKASLHADNKTMTVTQSVEFTNNSHRPLSELYFHIYPHRHYSAQEKEFMMRYAGYFRIDPFPEGFQSGDLEMASVKKGQASLLFYIEGEDKTILKVPLAETLRPGEKVTLTMDFTVKIPHAYGRFGWHENIASLSRW